MDFVGKKVKHTIFGTGVICKQDDIQVTVQFDQISEKKVFLYPTCFSSFLQLLDGDIQSEAENAIEVFQKSERIKKAQHSKEAMERYNANRVRNGPQNRKMTDIPAFDTVEDFCERYACSLKAEIAYIRRQGEKRHQIFDGKRILIKSDSYIYSFESDEELTYPEHTKIKIWKGADYFNGVILSCEDFTILISTTTYLGDEAAALEFSAESWQLLNALINRLEAMPDLHNPLVDSLLCDGEQAIDYSTNRIMSGQEEAVQMTFSQPITFIWGPPGTGKTQTLAKIALAHMEKGERVLMVSYSNVSVDGAVMRVMKLAKAVRPGQVLRYGYARRKDLLEHKFLTAYNYVLYKNPDLVAKKEKLQQEKKKVNRKDRRYVEIGKQLAAIHNQLKSSEIDAVKKAQFVATTISKVAVDQNLYEDKYDIVIFDEASMAYIPQIALAASLAEKHFICMGDFLQLPPIVQNDQDNYLNGDIFRYCRIAKAVEAGYSHKWLCMLDTQYRMYPSIADFASKSMYHSLLQTADGMKEKLKTIVNEQPLSGHPLSIVDLSGMMSVCMKTADGSRVNVLSALISFSLAAAAAPKMEVGIITPYHSQARLLHAMAADLAMVHPEWYPISCATVHQFQGSEKDMIIYDAVDCYRMPYPGMLLTSTANQYADRLFNVALTRARGKFVCVANVNYLENKNFSRNLMFRKLIDTIKGGHSYIAGDLLTHNLENSYVPCVSFGRDSSVESQYLRDIESAKSEIRIDIPDRPKVDPLLDRVVLLLEQRKRQGVKVIVRAENKEHLSHEIKKIAIENSFVTDPITVIDKNITWFGLPASDANFRVSDGVLPTRIRPVIRLTGRKTAKSLYGYLEMAKTIDQSNTLCMDQDGKIVTDRFSDYVLAHKKCCQCGKPMRLQKNRKGHFFLGCTGYPTCKNIELIEEDLVEDYLHRNWVAQQCLRCKCSLEAKTGPHGIYVRCGGIPSHIYKLDEI